MEQKEELKNNNLRIELGKPIQTRPNTILHFLIHAPVEGEQLPVEILDPGKVVTISLTKSGVLQDNRRSPNLLLRLHPQHPEIVTYGGNVFSPVEYTFEGHGYIPVPESASEPATTFLDETNLENLVINIPTGGDSRVVIRSSEGNNADKPLVLEVNEEAGL